MVLLGRRAALFLGLLGTALLGCQSQGSVLFSYSLLSNQGDFPVPFNNCLDSGISVVHLLLGNDANEDGLLDNNEVERNLSLVCNQNNTNEDAVISADELGSFGPLAVEPLSFDLFAVELVDAAGVPLPWAISEDAPTNTRTSFSADGLTIEAGQVTTITFAPQSFDVPQLKGELFVFLP